MFPLLLIAFGIVLCLFVSILATDYMEVDTLDRVERTLKMQLVISTLLLVPIVLLVAYLSFPETFKISLDGQTHTIYNPFICSIVGLVSGLFIAAFT